MSALLTACAACGVMVLAVLLHGCGQSQEHEFEPIEHFPDPSRIIYVTTTGTSTTTTTSPNNPGCSLDWQNCLKTGCCYDPSRKCYKKDDYFAACRQKCTPGSKRKADPKKFRVPWSCEEVDRVSSTVTTTTSTDDEKCTPESQSCKKTKCCGDLTCYQKDKYWAACRRSCKANQIDPSDPPNLQTPWSCKKVTPSTTSSTPSETSTMTTTSLQVFADESDGAVAAMRSTPRSTTTHDDAWLQTHCSANPHKGLLHITGLQGDTYAQGSPGVVSNDSLTLFHQSGYSIMTTCRSIWSPNEFVQFRLVGRTITFEVDLSKVGCACNLAFYLIAAPALDPAGMPSKGKCGSSPYYCDANKVCGQWCTELDIMEANNRVFQATPHKCDPPNPQGHYSKCDRSGCAQNTRAMPGTYGPGPKFIINTLLPFRVRSAFDGPNGVLTGMVTTLMQNGREVALTHANCDPAYLQRVGEALDTGMTLRITYWGHDAKTMGWMDQPPCGEEICSSSNAGPGIIRNIVVDPPQTGLPIRPIPGFLPPPPPLPPWTTSTTTTTTTTTAPPVNFFKTYLFPFLAVLATSVVGLYGAAVALLYTRPELGPGAPVAKPPADRSSPAKKIGPNSEGGGFFKLLQLQPEAVGEPGGVEEGDNVDNDGGACFPGSSSPIGRLMRASRAVNQIIRSKVNRLMGGTDDPA